ncbi:MAG: DUF3999 family protein [Gammaproteobacteria bacterium]
MPKRLGLLLPGLLLSALVQAKSLPGDFAYQAELTGSSHSLQRVQIPIEVLLAVTRDDLADISVFDSNANPLPSLIRRAPRQQQVMQIDLPFHVFSSYLKQHSKIVTTSEQTTQQDQVSEVRTTETVAVDRTRPVYIVELPDKDRDVSINSVELEWIHQPADQLLKLRVEVGNNLDSWRTIFNNKNLTNQNSDKSEWQKIGSIPKSQKYLRLTPLKSVQSFELQKVTGNYRQITPEVKIWHRLEALSELDDQPGFYAFDMPTAVKAVALRLVPGTEQTLIGGDLYASNDDFEHKRRIRSGFQQHNITSSEIKPGRAIDLPRQKYKHWWFRSDRELDLPPHVEIAFPVYEILFLGNGTGPFRLAWGNYETAVLNNDLNGLLSDEQKKGEAGLVHLRSVDIAGGEGRLAPAEQLPWLKWLLWLLMLAAVAATAKMALSLLRDMKTA